MKSFKWVSPHIRSRGRKRPAFHLNFELCEDRVLLAIPILVTTAADNGDNLDPTPGSLRQAILTANSTPGQNTIDFNIRGPGPIIIQPATALPTITNQVNLDGTTERTFLGLPAAGPPVVQINGNGLKGDGLVLGSGPPLPPVNSTTTLTSSPNPSVFGQSVTFTATAAAVLPGAGTPTGIVTFKDGTTTLGTGTLTAGSATFSTSTLTAGTHSITAVYSGDTHFTTSTSAPLTQTVNQAPAITSATSTTFTTGTAGSFTVTATGFPTPTFTESGALPSGVTFVDNGNGTATLASTTATPAGFTTLTITAANGVMPNATQNFTLTVVYYYVTPGLSLSETGALPSGVTFVDKGNGTATLASTTTSLSSSTNPSASGQSVTFTAPYAITGGTTSAGSTIVGLDIYNFGGSGIHIQTDGNLITDNFLGTDVNGTAAGPGNGTGVVIDNGASNNTIGGTGARAGNVISGNSSDGIDIGSFFPTHSSGNENLVQGNKIGTNAAGTAKLGNGNPANLGVGGAGVRFVDGMSNTVKNNVISGNVNEGIFLHGDRGANHEMVLNNFIGTNAAGTAPIGNGLSGITLNAQTAANTIDGNVISGNGVDPRGGDGISLHGDSLSAGPHDNLIQANCIGTNAAGTAALGNSVDGIHLLNASSNSIIGNVVSGNGINQDAAGINLESNDSNNTIAGNEIGTNAAGNAMLGNSLHGIFLGNGSSNNTIGGPTDNDRNVISGNGQFPVANSSTQGGVGVYIYGANTSGNVVQRNYIGTNATGSAALTSSVIGVLINQSGSNTVQGNVISGNQLIGVEIAGGTGGMASGNLVQGNKIGTNAGGTAAIPNGGGGIFINDAPNNVIGGTAAGAGNLISGNGSVGIQLFGTLTRGNVIQGNALGLNSAGRPTLPNRAGGIFVNTGPLNNKIGGTAPGQANRGQSRPLFTVSGSQQSNPGSTAQTATAAGRRFRIPGRARTSLRAQSKAH